LTKFEIAISTLFLGFALGQVTDVVKYKWKIWRKKKAIESEVEDIAADFNDKMLRIKQIIGELNNSHVAVQVPAIINTIIFDNHYSEVAPFLKRMERKSIWYIYTHVNNFNCEVNNGDRNNLALAKKSLFMLYKQSKFGYESALTFMQSHGEKSLMDQKEKIDNINAELQELAKICGIIS